MSGVIEKKYGNPAQPDERYEESLGKGRYSNRNAEDVKESSPDRVQRARKAGPHGQQTDTQGRNNALPAKRRQKTSGGDGGL